MFLPGLRIFIFDQFNQKIKAGTDQAKHVSFSACFFSSMIQIIARQGLAQMIEFCLNEYQPVQAIISGP